MHTYYAQNFAGTIASSLKEAQTYPGMSDHGAVIFLHPQASFNQ